jgi:hypothetical protein
MALKKSRAKKTVARGPRSQEPFLHFNDADPGRGLEQLAVYIMDEMNKNGHTVMAHARENIDLGARDTQVFFYFIVAGMVPPMSNFLHGVLTTYGMVLAHLHPNSLLAVTIFQHFCKVYVGVHHSVAFFHVFYDAHLDASSAMSSSLIFRLRPPSHMPT